MPVTAWDFIGVGILIILIAFFTDAFWIEKIFIETNEFFIGKATKRSNNIQVLQLSDLHLQSFNYQLIRLTKKINKIGPDLIIITGDAIDKAVNISILHKFLKLIDHNIPKVAVLGNWEYQSGLNLAELGKMYAGHNCNLLVNQAVQYLFHGKTMLITGVDDYLRGDADIEKAMKDYKKSDYHIVLTHCPQYADDISKKINKYLQVDFMLAGHTHGGQLNLFGFTPFLPIGSGKYVKGWYKNQYPELYVSKGIGTVFVPARFGARAEIAIFNLAI